MRKIKIVSSILGLLIIHGLMSCSSHPKQAEVMAPATQKSNAGAVGIEAHQVATEQNAQFVTELSFKKKQQTLSKANKKKLNKILDEAAQRGELEEIKVISWADSEYPSVHTKKLSKEEQKIAVERNDVIKSYIYDRKGKIEIATYSMAERANALKEFVGSSEARVKKSLEMAGIPTTDTTIKYPSKASKSIVMIIMK